MENIKVSEIVKGNIAKFIYAQDGKIFYKIENDDFICVFYIDLRDLEEVKSTRYEAEYNAIQLMRYLNKNIKDETIAYSKKIKITSKEKTMKDFLEYLNENPIFEGFSDKEDVFNHFAEIVDENIDILFAVYDTPPYEGSATVFFKDIKDDKYYEVYGSHCSCHGLEHQWSPEELLPIELEHRLNNKGGFTGSDIFVENYRKFKNGK